MRGHGLAHEGAPHDLRGRRIPGHGAGGKGRGKCACGALSEVLPSGGARKRWHAAHKAEVVGLPVYTREEAAARAMAVVGDDGVFEDWDTWHALEDWERKAYPEDEPDAEGRDFWLRLAQAALAAADAVKR